jgi:hypothetical protein
MNFKILNSVKKGSSIPKTNFIGIELPSTQRMLRRTDMAELVNQQDVFNEERGKCHKYRFVFTVNQLFTNVLFNQITRFPEHHRQSINDGEYDAYMFDSSLFGKYILENGEVYMGANILDNHLFRSDTISHANSLDSTRGEKEKEYEYVYSVDTTMSFFGVMQTGIYEKNGWLGVKNPSKIRLNRDDDKPLFVDKSACDIIDFFPTKDFFSFYGIYDEKAHESKDNWKYVLTYPFDNDMQHYLVNKGIPVLSMQVLDNGSLEIRTAYKNNLQYGDVFILTDETQGDKVEYECSVFSVDESQNAIEVKYYPSEYDGESRRVFINSNNNYDIADSGKIYNVISRNGDFNVHITKKENGLLNRYYIRKFRKIPNFKFEQFEVNGDNIEEMIYRNRDVGFSSENYKLSFAKNAYNDDMSQITYNEDVDVESLMDNLGRPISKVYLTIIKDNDEIIRKYSGGDEENIEYPFTKVQSGFKLTNFNRKDIMLKKDGMMQDVFTRGDSNNLPFTALYDKYCNIQYVHSVGTEESGFVNFENLSESSKLFRMNDFYTPKIYRDKYRIKEKLIDTDQEQETQIFTKHVIPLEDNISEMGHRNPASSSSDIEPWFYGDIVEYSPSQCMETTLEDIYYRFNTSQRESCKECDNVISFNEIIYDEFDLQGDDGISKNNFQKIIDNGRYQYTSSATKRTTAKAKDHKMIYRGLLCVGPRPEGYMYKPHYEIQLKKWSKNIHQGVFQQYRVVKTGIDVTLLNPFKKDLATGEYTVPNPNSPEVRYRYFVFDRRHGLHSGDFIRIFSKDGSFSFKYNVKVDSLDKFKISIFDDESLTRMIDSGVEYEITKYAYDVPPYAEYVGDGRYLWRDLLGDGERDYEDGSVLEHVFANGRFYLNQNITLAMQRQDPMGDAGLLYLNFPQDIIGETDTRRKRDKSNTNYSC